MKRALPPPEAVPVGRLFTQPSPVTDPEATRWALERLARAIKQAIEANGATDDTHEAAGKAA